METKQDFKEHLEILQREADKCYYVGPTVTFFTGVALGFTPSEPGISVLDVVFVGALLGGIAWFIFRAIKKGRAEKKYQDALNQYYKEFIRGE